jgi:putative ABC transport system permease protein
VAPNDPVTLASVAMAMMAIGVAACWVPARRAAKVDPAVAMRGR